MSDQTDNNSIKLESSWRKLLEEDFSKPYMIDLKSFLKNEYLKGKVIFPAGNEYFAALNLTPFPKVKAVIIGQDPYHGPKQAHGLSFSVRPGVPLPPSLRNIYKELHADLGLPIPRHGFLKKWADQGVLMLNSVLTVERASAGSHANRGWEKFTDRIIALLNEQREGLAFVLWGAYAQRKGELIDKTRHFVVSSAHPSPFSADRGFFGSRPFSKINRYLIEHNQTAIDWRLPEINEAALATDPTAIFPSSASVQETCQLATGGRESTFKSPAVLH